MFGKRRQAGYDLFWSVAHTLIERRELLAQQQEGWLLATLPKEQRFDDQVKILSHLSRAAYLDFIERRKKMMVSDNAEWATGHNARYTEK